MNRAPIVHFKIMKPASKKRSTKAIRLLLVSSAFILEGCSPQKTAVTPASMTPEQELARMEEAERKPDSEIQPVPPSPQSTTGTKNQSHSGWSYLNPFIWGYGSGGYGRSGSSYNSWSSNSSNGIRTGTSGSYRSSGPASFFGGPSSTYTPSRTTGSSTPIIHTPTTHSSTSTSHTSSPSVSRGGFGGHASSASS